MSKTAVQCQDQVITTENVDELSNSDIGSDEELQQQLFFQDWEINKERITLEGVRAKTENFTVYEKEPGFLKYVLNPSTPNQEGLNSKVICRARYVIRKIAQEYALASESEFHAALKEALRKTYEKYCPEIYAGKDGWLFKIDTTSSYPSNKIYMIYLTVPDARDFLMIEVKIST